ncbi:MAG: 30S ribosomal protein S9 [Candidatus Undinarchaeales archaeon]|jgi:small subunit ribosomal protein S9|nr:30S ribosomal protein S9 [Candidatus Undinarchaeales archaeon]
MSKKSITTTGKKKSAVARATVQNGAGKVTINSIPVEKWGTYYERNLLLEPMQIIGSKMDKLDIGIKTNGGGPSGQAVASRVALARGVIEFTGDKTLKKELITYDNKIFSGDSRQKEPCKPNDSSARSKRQKSYR